MAKNLVIVESPTKAKTISKFLGSSYKVMATGGHLRDLPKSRMGVDIENDFEPEYINVRGKAPKINELKAEKKKADKVYLATDPDREGEAIAWHLNYLLGFSEDEENRVEFHEITKDAVKSAIKKPRKIDKNLVDAQQARRVMDRIMGYELSPVLWKRVKNGLSAGRVQSVALRIICEREEEIEKFIPEEYWTITADHEEKGLSFQSTFQGVWKSGKLKKIELKSESETREVTDGLPDKFLVREVKKRKRTRKPYAPYTTSTLQQDASIRIGFTTSRTMRVAQGLFEGVNIGTEGTVGLISYMRTDSTRLSSQIINEALSYISEKFGDEYKSKGNPYGKNNENAQDAHEAIRPSSIYRSPESIRSYLTNDQYKLYKLIWTRTLASQMTSAEFDQTTINFDASSYYFRSTGSVMTFPGFTKVWKGKESQEALPDLEENSYIGIKKVNPNQHFTKPQARYTEASLVKKMEEDGIGRPSTYSATINSILSRNYVELKEKQFYPTEIGQTVNKLLVNSFSDVINEEFTAQMEDELDDISEDKKDWKDVLREFYKIFSNNMDDLNKDDTSYKIEDEILDEKCPKCGKNLVKKKGRRGDFIGCSGFPDCDYTRAIVKKIVVKCPKCKDGDIIERVSKRGKIFYGCSNYPDCDFALWDKPLDDYCPECGSILVRKKNRKQDIIKCSKDENHFSQLTSEYLKKRGEIKL